MRSQALLAVTLGVILLSAPMRAEEGPPSLDIEKTCQSPGRTQIQVQANQQDSEDGCLRSERAAHDELKKRWGEFPAQARNQCTKQAQAGGFPSYVETVTCLELATGIKPAQLGGDKPSASEPIPNEAGTKIEPGKKLTSEPSPNQRTNPIDVLEKKP